MRTRIVMVTAGTLFAVVVSLAGMKALSKRENTSTSGSELQPPNRSASTADRQIQLAEAKIRNLPAVVEGYDLLASGYLQKVRETGNFGYNARAESALNRALQIAPNDQTTLTLRATLLLTYHRFKEAFEEAQRAKAAGP